jgi:4-amino-4-deoxy-L-arabinose transferase-like glycosyltransferase
MSVDSYAAPSPAGARARSLAKPLQRLVALPELAGLLGLSAILNLWGLSINGWANTYYAAAVKSMSSSWHDFLFASLDKSGLMTVDKPPLSLWVQALSARIFGFHSLSLLVPQALMGIGAVALTYDLVRRRFGRFAGFVAGLALATTPVAVAVSRHNNPDELLVLCSVAALWCAVRALETGRTRWLVWTGVCVGLGFETKMGVALLVVPGIAAAYMWVAPKGRVRAIRQLLAGGASMVLVGGAWPLLVTLTPAADRPWISGTSDNSIWSLIFGYNGLGRVAGQSGGPQAFGGGGTMFGGATGPLRLLQTGLGDQAGWLLGFAVVAGVGLLVSSRLRRRDPRTGWLVVVGGALLTTAVVFSFASGIFHPYYVSLLAPFIAALIGAGVGQMLASGRAARVLAPLAIASGAITELVVLNEIGGQLSWAVPLVIAVAGLSALALMTALSPRTRKILLGVALAALMAAPATWAAETIGHATNGTFPTGGPASASIGGPGGGGPPGGVGGARGGGRSGGFAGGPPAGFAGGGPPAGFAGGGAPGGFAGGGARRGSGGGGPGGFGSDSATLNAVVRYTDAHGGGTIGVESQGSAATEILSANANIAGLGGFSGRESTVSATWIAQQVESGHLRWIVAENSGGGAPGDTRTGSRAALSIVAQTCRVVSVTANGTKVKLYDCLGRGSAILRAAQASSAAADK